MTLSPEVLDIVEKHLLPIIGNVLKMMDEKADLNRSALSIIGETESSFLRKDEKIETAEFDIFDTAVAHEEESDLKLMLEEAQKTREALDEISEDIYQQIEELKEKFPEFVQVLKEA